MNEEQTQVIVLVTMACSPYINYTIPFVGYDYYCESGHGIGESGWILYSNDLLWDGKDCPGCEAICCIT